MEERSPEATIKSKAAFSAPFRRMKNSNSRDISSSLVPGLR
jgi:hypothetical protein